MIYSEGANVSFNNSNVKYAASVIGLENCRLTVVTNVAFSDCPIAICANGNEDDIDIEDRADDLDCRIEDIKCAALDAKAILDEVQAHFDKLSTEIESLKAQSEE